MQWRRCFGSGVNNAGNFNYCEGGCRSPWSLEIISSHYNKGAYYAGDKKVVRQAGVDHVMGILLRKYTEQGVDPLDLEEACVVCDEENLDA